MLERDRTRARENARRRRAAQRAAKGGRCEECSGALAPEARLSRFCSKDCRIAATTRKNRDRIAAGPPAGTSWPAPVTALTTQLRRLEAERRIAPRPGGASSRPRSVA